MIRCDLIPVKEHGSMTGGEGNKTKHGKYHGSMFWDVPGFASKKWIVGTRIKIEGSVPVGMSDKDLIEGCVEYINAPPPRKKFQRRQQSPKYGKLDLYKAKVIRSEDGSMYISALLITDKRKSKHFWGKGIVSK